ncbi:hypothetical protein HZY91_05535 [Facklamia sp. DSM 111018]|uniref:Rhamnogalacturonase A/B/Epimerase-like pectate lyase domain-containing protein n=1 Tax=Facklamia lactis TaxID=2749967 RepID=A0ABS0LSB5_9LACT|nr:glycosyl hydrolase family 28-related protein [Facklamia lactis]MBG9986355.1 hypothetical protein [Facklamia lactis]
MSNINLGKLFYKISKILIGLVLLLLIMSVRPLSLINSAPDSGSENIVNIKDYGAKFNDPTFDNMPIIQKIQDDLTEKGGGTIYIPDNGDLYIKPHLKLQSNIHFLGDETKSTIKLTPDTKNFWTIFLIEHVENISFKNLEINTNKEQRTDYDIAKEPQMIFSLAESHHIDVENNDLIGNGVWIYASHINEEIDYSTELSFNNNIVIWKAGDSSKKNNLPKGVSIDNSILYFDALDYDVHNNTFITQDGTKNMTAIEAHGANVEVSNNTIDGFRTGLIVWSLVQNTPRTNDIKENNFLVENNLFNNVENGVTIGASTGAKGDFDIKGVEIINNKILLNPDKFDRGSSRGIEIYIPNKEASGIGENIKIDSNVIQSFPDKTIYKDSSSIYNFTGINISSGELDNIQITNNDIINNPGLGISLSNTYPETIQITNSVITDNTVIDQFSNENITISNMDKDLPVNIKESREVMLLNLILENNRVIYIRETDQ